MAACDGWQVLEVVVSPEKIYIVMEHLSGADLDEWLEFWQNMQLEYGKGLCEVQLRRIWRSLVRVEPGA